MSADKIIDGKAFAAGLRERIGRETARLKAEHGLIPGLAVVLVGDNPASQVYVRNKARQTAEAGMRSFEHKLPPETGQDELLALCPIRVLLWRLLPKGDYWVPSAVRAAREDEYLWQEMASLSWDDYDEQWRRRLIEQVVILGSGVKRWKASHWTSKPKSGGRKPGSGALTAQDCILWEKMKRLLVQQEAVSAWDAARHFANEAPGKGSFDSKRRRLANGYNNWISTQ